MIGSRSHRDGESGTFNSVKVAHTLLPLWPLPSPLVRPCTSESAPIAPHRSKSGPIGGAFFKLLIILTVKVRTCSDCDLCR